MTETGKQTPGSLAFVPSVAGLMLAAEVVRELAGTADESRDEESNGCK